MRFTDDNVDIPEDLISVLFQNRLVVFVGSGLSAKAYPRQQPNTYYPTFNGLCKQIATDLSIEVKSEHKEDMNTGRYDSLLGTWKDDGENVHESAARILSTDEDKKRLVLHKAIIELFPVNSEPRIVTTNFDNLLNIAHCELKQDNSSTWDTYEAPALPPGNRFTGICYLHGRVTKPKEMILTDKDIGRAYMDEGWALKFAHELFRTSPVLFIGYSLNDPLLRYLSLALEGTKTGNTENKTDKWVIIPEKKDSKEIIKKWRRQGVKPITYPFKYNNHRSLERTMIGWFKYNKQGFVDRRNQLYQFAKSHPNQLVPHQKDLVLSYLKEPELLRDLAKYDFDDGWFDELIRLGYFDKLLKTNEYLSNEYHLLANKLVDSIIKNPTDWILKLSSYRETLHPILFDTFCMKVDMDEKFVIQKQTLRQILEFFRPSIQNNTLAVYGQSFDKLFEKLIEYDFHEDATWLLLSILDVEIKIKTSFSFLISKIEGGEKKKPIELDSDVSFKGQDSDYLFSTYMEKYFEPNIPKIGYILLLELTCKLRTILISIERIKPITFTYIQRPYIGKGKKHSSHSVIDLFIDTLIKTWESLLKEKTDQALLIYQLWRQIDVPYFKRMTLYALTKLIEVDYVK